MRTILEEARSLRKAMHSVVPALDDATASTAPKIFPRLKEDGSIIKSGIRINWKGKLMRAAVDLWDTAENNPDNAPTLWETIDYTNGCRTIPETITVGLAFAKGELGWWKDAAWESLYDNNVWNPEQFAAGWKKI